MNTIHRCTLCALALSLLSGPLRAEDRKYTLPDLQALEQRKAWPELMAHLQDVPPADRHGDWNRLAEHACLTPGNTEDSNVSDWCADQLKSLMEAEPANAELAWKSGKWARKNRVAWVAVSFFAKAITKPGDARCKDEDVALATISGLGLPADSNASVVAESKALAFERCWPALKPALKKEFQEEGGYFRDNACPDLKKKGALTTEEIQKCGAK